MDAYTAGEAVERAQGREVKRKRQENAATDQRQGLLFSTSLNLGPASARTTSFGALLVHENSKSRKAQKGMQLLCPSKHQERREHLEVL